MGRWSSPSETVTLPVLTSSTRVRITPMSLENDIHSAIARIPDPEIGRSLADLEMIKGIASADGKTTVTIELPTPAYPGRERIETAIRAAASPFRRR